VSQSNYGKKVANAGMARACGARFWRAGVAFLNFLGMIGACDF